MDRHRSDADPNPDFLFDADPDPDPDPTLNSLNVGKPEIILDFYSQQCQFTLFYLSGQRQVSVSNI